jgi:hypothetical protein
MRRIAVIALLVLPVVALVVGWRITTEAKEEEMTMLIFVSTSTVNKEPGALIRDAYNIDPGNIITVDTLIAALTASRNKHGNYPILIRDGDSVINGELVYVFRDNIRRYWSVDHLQESLVRVVVAWMVSPDATIDATLDAMLLDDDADAMTAKRRALFTLIESQAHARGVTISDFVDTMDDGAVNEAWREVINACKLSRHMLESYREAQEATHHETT